MVILEPGEMASEIRMNNDHPSQTDSIRVETIFAIDIVICDDERAIAEKTAITCNGDDLITKLSWHAMFCDSIFSGSKEPMTNVMKP